MGSISTVIDSRPVFFFDVDDCLYPRTLGVNALIEELIDKFIMKKFGVDRKAATRINEEYYSQYGLTVIGLQRLHGIDPMEFNREVDGLLPMSELLSKTEELIQFFSSFDRTKVKLWLFTNAHVHHGLKVTSLLGISQFFEGITYCDYASDTWICKPSNEMFAKAEQEAGASSGSKCYFVDDNVKNCAAASKRGWQVLWIAGDEVPADYVERRPFGRIADLREIRQICPQFMKQRRDSY